MKKFFLLSFVAVLMGLVSTSCLGEVETPDYVTQQNFAECYAISIDQRANDGQYTVDNPVTVFLRVNMSKGLCTVTFSGLKKEDGSAMPQFSLVDMKWTPQNNVWGVATAMTPTVSSNSGAAPKIKNVKFEWNNRIQLSQALANADFTVCKFEFTLDDTYQIIGGNRIIVMGGETTSTPVGGEAFSSKKPYYKIVPDFAKKTADINIINAQFANGMPAMSMDFTDVPMSIDYGTITLKAENLVPSIKGVPYPSFPISNLKLQYMRWENNTTLSFGCMVRGVPYTVNASLTFDAVPEQ